MIERFCSPKEYIGVDIEKGKFLDVVLPAEKLVEYFGEESFDVVISTELLEHVKDWRLVINNMKKFFVEAVISILLRDHMDSHIMLTHMTFGDTV